MEPRKPDGQPRGELDVEPATESLCVLASTDLETSLRATNKWFG